MTTTDLDTTSATRVFVEAWRYMAGQYPGHILAQIGPVEVMLSQTSCAFFNMLALNGPVRDEAALRQAVATARGYADQCPHDTMLLLPPDFQPEQGGTVLADHGAAFNMSLWGMAADTLAPPRRAEPALEFRVARDEATALELGWVNADAYGMPREVFAVTGRIPTWSGTQVGVVGYAGGKPVTAAQAYLLDDCIYIAMVATLPEGHGKGYGEAAMRRAIGAVQEVVGEKRLWLHATEMGRPLYRSMGFAEGARMDLYGFA